jgi:hypothetical protein
VAVYGKGCAHAFHAALERAMVRLVLGKFGFKPIQTRFEPNRNRKFGFGLEILADKPNGSVSGFGNWPSSPNGFTLSLHLSYILHSTNTNTLLFFFQSFYCPHMRPQLTRLKHTLACPRRHVTHQRHFHLSHQHRHFHTTFFRIILWSVCGRSPTRPLPFEMAASSADFEWFHDPDDEHPIGQSTETLTANSSTAPHLPAVPSNRVRQLRGQPKVAIKSASAKAVANTRRTNPRKRRHSDDHNDTTLQSKTTAAQGKGKGKQVVAIEVDSELEMDDTTSADDDSSSDDDDDLSVQDKSVSLCCFIRLSTDTIYYRNASAAIVSVAKTSAVPTSILCFRRGYVLKVAKSSKGGGASSASTYLISFPQCILIMLYRRNRKLAHGVGFYKGTNSTSTLRAHFTREAGEHYKYYREMCEKNNIPAVAKSPEVKGGDSVSLQSNISSFLTSAAPPWHREGLLSHICEWIVLDDQVRISPL